MKIHKLGIVLTGIAMAVGVGLGIGGSDSPLGAKAINYAASCDFSLITAKNTSYNSSWSYGEWTIYAGANNNGGWTFMKFGGKNTTIATANPTYIRGQVASKAVSKIEVKTNAGNLTVGSVNSWGVKIYSDNYTTQIDAVTGSTMTAKTAQTLYLSPSSGDNWPAGSYYEVYFDLANTTTTNGIVWVDGVFFEEYADASIDLTDLTYTGSLERTTYAEGDDFDPTGLTVTAKFSDDSEVDVTSQVQWADLVEGGTSVVGTYSYTGSETVQKSITVTGLTITAAPILGGIVDGHTYLVTAAKASTGDIEYVLKANNGGVTSWTSAGGSKDFTEVFTSAANYTLAEGFVFTKTGINTYTIKSGANFLNAIGDNNGLRLNSTSDQWIVTEAVGTTTGGVAYDGVFLQNVNASRYLTLYATAPDFRSYTSTTSQPLPAACIVLYDMTALQGYANGFKNAMDGVCDADGETAVSALASSWSIQASAFAGLTAKSKAVFADSTNAIGNQSGTSIQQAIAAYEYIAAKYNTQLMETGWEFMGRNVAPLSKTGTGAFGINETSTNISIIIASVAFVALGSFFLFVLKKKELVDR